MATRHLSSKVLFALTLFFLHLSPSCSAQYGYDNDNNNGLDNYLDYGTSPGGYVQYNPLDDVPSNVPLPQPFATSRSASSTNTGQIDTINTINVVSTSNTVGGPVQSSNMTGRSYDTQLTDRQIFVSTAQCQQALQQCSLFSVDEASLDNVYEQAFSAMLQRQRLQYQDNLVRFRDFFINMLNSFIINPDQSLSGGGACQGANSPVYIQPDPTNSLPDPNSVPDINVPRLQQCLVSQWSAWSAPIGFGIIERQRTIIRQGQCCPDDLKQTVNITSFINSFQNPDNVADNFHNDFMNQEPRDILLVIDTSSSIFRDDFELMKEGIKTMIDLFCGSFGYSANNNRLAIIQFSTRPYVIHYFSDPQTPDALKAKVATMQDFGGKTCTGDALLLAYQEVFQVSRGARLETPNDTLVVTDGRANCGADLLQSAKTLQLRSQSVYALGIGIAGDVAARAQVTSLVTGENPRHIFSLARYRDFKQMIDFIKLRQNGQPCTPLVPQNK